jgi:hypothetical protein
VASRARILLRGRQHPSVSRAQSDIWREKSVTSWTAAQNFCKSRWLSVQAPMRN